ncbi:hypothetical protein QWT69_10770 [Sporosarcina oncorhynchi]|uniref:RNA polymerase sigma factor 70 region 4 type 2 domain-containing protein n=1 Tax=Sporosarcina oncorhynchi TaxID=3056444 RepID=A0ABZ0L2K0_9BACL|nr:hypothetical protein [Sporosarcina sp. T2O-4]WOV86399.1 hypothetical protein QWT69_10770 [Sporosarcina sp. T2O-4]
MDRIVNGDHEAFMERITFLMREVELLSVQYGVTTEDAKTVTETLFVEVYQKRHLLTEELLEEDELIKRVLSRLANMELKPSTDRLFAFIEDDELHNRIMILNQTWRVPLILSKFHTKTTSEIAAIVEIPEQQVLDAINGAMQKLDEPNLEKRLEFLGRSYNRLPSEVSDLESILAKSAEQPALEVKKTGASKKKTILLWALGAVLAFFFTYGMIMNSDTYQQSVGEKIIENAVKEFEDQLDRRLQLAGLPDDKLKYNQSFSHGNDVRTRHELFIIELRNQLQEQGKINKKRVGKEQVAFMNRISLPTDLIDQLEKEPLKNDEKNSMRFLSELYESVQFLTISYSMLLEENMNKVLGEEYDYTSSDYMETLLAKDETLPKTLREALDGMEKHGFSLISFEDIFVYPVFGNEEVEKTLIENLHPSVDFYLSIITGGVDHLEIYPLDDQVEKLLEIEQDLLVTDEESIDMLVFSAYTRLLVYINGLHEEEKIYTPLRTVKDEYRDAWLRIASNGDNPISGQLMQDIVQEMEASGWTYSAKHRDLIYLLFNERFEQMVLQIKEKKNMKSSDL